MSYDVLEERDVVANDVSRAPRRLLVTVRAAQSPGLRHRVYRHVGLLSRVEVGYWFRYCAEVQDNPDFRPLIGFPRVDAIYQSDELFPLFSQRVMSARRPDRPHYLNALDLSEDSEPWEVLSRSGGRRAGDAIEVIPEPIVTPDGRTESVFLVHGVRHRGVQASEAIGRLRVNDELRLMLDEENSVNPRAVLVRSDGTELGYVPDPLVEYVRTVMVAGEHRLSVVRANGPEVGPHLRLLVRLEGSVPVGYQPF